MQKLGDDFKQAGGEWKDVELRELFEKKTMKGFPKRDENLSENDKGYHIFGQNIKYQYPQKVLLDEKYLHYVNPDKPILAYTSSASEIGMITESFYRSGDNGAFQGLFPKFTDYNKRHILYFLATLQKYFVTFGYSTGMANVIDLAIPVPYINGEIAFQYMESYIKTLEAERIETLEAERIETLEAYLTVTGLKDYHLTEKDEKVLERFAKLSDTESRVEYLGTYVQYELQSIFKWGEKISELNPLHLDSLEDLSQPAYPFYGQATTDNGIISYRQLTKTVLNNEQSLPTLLIHSNNQNIVYLETPFYLKDGHGATSVLQSDNLNRYTAFYLMTAIKKVIEKRFNYNAKATKIGLKLTEVTLPTVNEKVNYDFMSDLIRAVEKLVIKDLVEWTDKRIEATKEIVAR